MVAEGKAAADRLAAAQERARHSAHRGNMAAARKAAKWWQEEDQARAAVLARAREHQYPLPSFGAHEDDERRHCQASEDRRRL
jgi:hypothetical protein